MCMSERTNRSRKMNLAKLYTRSYSRYIEYDRVYNFAKFIFLYIYGCSGQLACTSTNPMSLKVNDHISLK